MTVPSPDAPRPRSAARSRRAPVSRCTLASLAAAAGLVAAPVLTGPAAAHDTLLETVPADGATVTEAPDAVTLTFSADLLATGTAARVAAADGTEVAAGEPELDGPVVTVPLPADLPASTYEVTWRVVSSDGHPISGVTDFTVENQTSEQDAGAAAPATSAPSTQEPSTAAPSATTEVTTPSDASTPAAEDTAGQGSAESLVLPVLVGLGVMAVVAIGIVTARRRPRP